MSRHNLTSRVLRDFATLVSVRGRDAVKLGQRSGLNLTRIADKDVPVSFAAVGMLFELAAIELRNDAFGLELSKLGAPGVLGQAAELAANGANLREALRLRSQYLALCSNAFALKLRENRLGAQLILQFDPQTTPPQQLSDYLAANILGWIRAVLREKNWSPLRTDFEHREPKRLKIFKAEFGENLRFGSNATRFLLDHGSLDRTIPGADSQRIKRLRARADAKLQALATAQRIARSAEDKIVELLPNGWASTGDVAAALRISSRTLQRSLTSEGLSFRELLETARISRAEHLLTKTNLPLTEIAFQLGYAELSAFSRAAKMWFGVPPQSLRKRGR